MGFMRKEFSRLIASDSVFFLLMDSSPQGFQNWMMAEVFGIEGSELLKVMSMFFDCCEFGSSVEAGIWSLMQANFRISWTTRNRFVGPLWRTLLSCC